MNSTISNFFKDHKGRIVIWQTPNVLLYSWIFCKVASLAIHNPRLDSGFKQLASALLIAWAYLEITKGASTFRKFLGAVVFGVTVFSLFK